MDGQWWFCAPVCRRRASNTRWHNNSWSHSWHWKINSGPRSGYFWRCFWWRAEFCWWDEPPVSLEHWFRGQRNKKLEQALQRVSASRLHLEVVRFFDGDKRQYYETWQFEMCYKARCFALERALKRKRFVACEGFVLLISSHYRVTKKYIWVEENQTFPLDAQTVTKFLSR